MSNDLHAILSAELFDALQIEELRRCNVMGLPCLHGNDQIVASLNAPSRSLIIKLPENLVNYLVAEGWGQPFAPSGRIHSQWVEITHLEPRLWVEMIREASRFAYA